MRNRLVIFFALLSIHSALGVPIIRAQEVSSGTREQLDNYRVPYKYVLPSGKSPDDIVGMGIAPSQDRVYVWFRDGTVSSGTSSDLSRYRKPYNYTLPHGKQPDDIVGMGIAGSNSRVYVWYRDGTVSSGTFSNLRRYRSPFPFSTPRGKAYASIRELAISRKDHVYAWYAK